MGTGRLENLALIDRAAGLVNPIRLATYRLAISGVAEMKVKVSFYPQGLAKQLGVIKKAIEILAVFAPTSY